MKIFSIIGTNYENIETENTSLPEGYIEMFGRRPSIKHTSQADGTWGYPLELAKKEKWQEMKVIRNQKEQAGLPYMGKVLDVDALSMQRIVILVQAAQTAINQNQKFSINWTTKDNSEVLLTAQDVVGIPVAFAQYNDKLHVKAQSLKEAIYKAETLEEIEKFSWEGC